ncbi:hypothetical protein D1159_17530 [Pseudoflavonifractor sp. 524-17]|nr:hypothetical protein [Pseudoflavonifractor sp. 524-17]
MPQKLKKRFIRLYLAQTTALLRKSPAYPKGLRNHYQQIFAQLLKNMCNRYQMHLSQAIHPLAGW